MQNVCHSNFVIAVCLRNVFENIAESSTKIHHIFCNSKHFHKPPWTSNCTDFALIFYKYKCKVLSYWYVIVYIFRYILRVLMDLEIAVLEKRSGTVSMDAVKPVNNRMHSNLSQRRNVDRACSSDDAGDEAVDPVADKVSRFYQKFCNI